MDTKVLCSKVLGHSVQLVQLFLCALHSRNTDPMLYFRVTNRILHVPELVNWRFLIELPLQLLAEHA